MKCVSLTALLAFFGATAAHADCAQDFRAMMDAHAKAGRYHSSAISTFQDKQVKMSVDVIVPSSFHVLEGPDGGKNETIVTADAGWDKIGDGKWTQMSPENHQKALKFFQSGLSSGFPDATNVACLGQQDIEGQKLTGFSFERVMAFGAQTFTDHIAIYKGSNNLPAILVGDRDTGKGKSHTVQHIEYDPGIEIKQPE